MKKLVLFLFLFMALSAYAQTDSASSPLSFSGYLETYYQYDLGNPANHQRPGFIYSYDRHNEVNLNLGLAEVVYSKDNVKASLGLMAGTYTNANLAAEPATLKNVFEANISFKLAKKKDLWLAAGIMPSHIGFESAIGKNCWTLSRSILADNSPYYESGVKIAYTSPSRKWLLSALVLNGWQHMVRPLGSNTPAFGHQLTFTPNDKVSLNSSSFIGNEQPDSISKWRFFHNFYGQFQVSRSIGLITGFDIGAQQKVHGSTDYSIWYSPVIIMRLLPADNKFHIGLRVEYYADKDQIMIATGTTGGFQTYGYSANLDYAISDQLLWRVEGRMFQSKDEIFILDGNAGRMNYSAATLLAFSF